VGREQDQPPFSVDSWNGPTLWAARAPTALHMINLVIPRRANRRKENSPFPGVVASQVPVPHDMIWWFRWAVPLDGRRE
jgi:hypothetical protein